MANYSQTDPRWAGFLIGPHQGVADVRHGTCGCYLAVLTTVFNYQLGTGELGGSRPRFPTQLFFVGTSLTFNPEYLDTYLAGRFVTGQGGYEDTDPGACGVDVLDNGLEEAALPVKVEDESGNVIFQTPSGVRMRRLPGFHRDLIDRNLRNLQPTIVSLAFVSSTDVRRHVHVIVGWDDRSGRYLVVDPASRSSVPTVPQDYDEWEAAIARHGGETIDVQPVNQAGRWLQLRDDPSPVEFFAVGPNGRRTGFDPDAGQTVMEDPAGSYGTTGAWTDLLGVLPEGQEGRTLGIRNPEDGAYRFEVVGTRDGPLRFSFVRVDGTQETTLFAESGTISAGERRKFVVRYTAAGEGTVQEVGAFTPQADAGRGAEGLVGAPIAFNGGRSLGFNAPLTTFEWEFGDGASATGRNVSHSYEQPGSYTATLTVTDSAGRRDSDTVPVTVFGPVDPALAGTTELLSVSSSGQPQTGLVGSGRFTAISDTGRHVAFSSGSPNLVPGDTNGAEDVFVRDRTSGTTERVSVATTGSQASLASRDPSISGDGRFVAFDTDASLSTGDVDTTATDVYVRDRTNGTTELISAFPAGDSRNGQAATTPAISADGRYVAFRLPFNVYIHDRQTDTTELVGSSGSQFNERMAIDGTGDHVAFHRRFSISPSEVVVWSRATGQTETVSVSGTGVKANGNSVLPTISADGRFVAFTSFGNNLVLGDTNGYGDVFVRDRFAGTTTRVSVSTSGLEGDLTSEEAAISRDGKLVAFASFARTLVPGDTNGFGFSASAGRDVFLRDIEAGRTARVIAASGMEPIGGNAQYPAVNSDGRVIAFESSASGVADEPGPGTSHNTYAWSRLAQPPPPVAVLGGPYLGWAGTAERPTAVRLDGSRSFDRGGKPLTATWDFGDGSTPMTTNDVTSEVRHAYDAPGRYTITLLVHNGTRSSAPETTAVEVLPPPPADRVDVTPSCGPSGTPMQISGIAGTANAGLLANGWDLSAGAVPLQPVPLTVGSTRMERPTSLPDFSFSAGPLTAAGGSDIVISTGTPSTTFTIPCPPVDNRLPEADAGGPRYSGLAGEPVSFDGSGSTDPESRPLTYSWDFGDLSSGSGRTPQHTFTEPGTYFVQLTVNDGVRDSQPHIGDRSLALVTIAERSANRPPTANAGGPYDGAEGGDIALSASAADPDHDPLTLHWSYAPLGPVDAGITCSFTAPDAAATSFRCSDDGAFRVTLSVHDGVNAAVTASADVTVRNADPVISPLTFTGNRGVACTGGDAVSVRVPFADPAANDTVVGSIDWGDGSPPQDLSPLGLAVTHTYAPGTYTVRATVTDDDGGVGTREGVDAVSHLFRAPGGFLQPINNDGTSVFKLGSTIPVAVDVVDCAGAAVPGLSPDLDLVRLDSQPDGPVNEPVSSSNADTGDNLRAAGDKYTYNLSTKRSQFCEATSPMCAGADLTQGTYRLTVDDSDAGRPIIEPLSVIVNLRK